MVLYSALPIQTSRPATTNKCQCDVIIVKDAHAIDMNIWIGNHHLES